MRTILISGSDTGVGKTHVCSQLAAAYANTGARVQIVKAIETGVTAGGWGDADEAARLAGASVETHTLFRFSRALAPLAAARYEGRTLRLPEIVAAVHQLPITDWRLIEGAGGLAVPIDPDGSDWADLARELKVDACVLVVEDRLGAINLARLLFSHVQLRKLAPAMIVLNALHPQSEDVRSSNRQGIADSGILCHGGDPGVGLRDTLSMQWHKAEAKESGR